MTTARWSLRRCWTNGCSHEVDKKQKSRPYWEYLSVLGYAAMLLAVLAFFSGHGAFIYEGF